MQCPLPQGMTIFDGKYPETMDSTDVVVSVTFTNFSPDAWTLDVTGWQGPDGWSGPTQLPSNPLLANSGQQTMAANESFTWFLQPPLNIWCCWIGKGGYRFGVFLHGQLQFIGIGKRPDWYVMSDYAPPGSNPDWVLSGSDPADQYIWKNCPPQYTIVAVPDSTHSSLSIQIQINPVPSEQER